MRSLKDIIQSQDSHESCIVALRQVEQYAESELVRLSKLNPSFCSSLVVHNQNTIGKARALRLAMEMLRIRPQGKWQKLREEQKGLQEAVKLYTAASDLWYRNAVNANSQEDRDAYLLKAQEAMALAIEHEKLAWSIHDEACALEDDGA